MESYKNLVKLRKTFLSEHKNEYLTYCLTESDVLISIPHAVEQTRLGKPKYAEIGTLAFGLTLAKELDANYIVRTQNLLDDPNFDAVSPYRDKIEYILSANGIKYLLDIHGLKKSRDCDVNLGTRFGKNIESDLPLYEKLEKGLKDAGFVVTTDNPFMANIKTISGYFSEKHEIFTLQIEINSKITNESANFKKFQLLVQTLVHALKKR